MVTGTPQPNRRVERPDQPRPPGWALLSWAVLKLLGRATLLGLRLTLPLLRTVASHTFAGWRHIAYCVADRLPGLLRGTKGLVQAAGRGASQRLLGPLFKRALIPTLRVLMLPAALVGAVAGAALLLHHVDAPAAPKDAARGEARRNALLATEDPFSQATPSLDAAKLASLRTQLEGSDAKAAAAALARLQKATAEDAPLLHRELLRRTKLSAGRYKAILRRVGAHVPDHRGRFPQKRKKPKLDWLRALQDLDPGRLSPGMLRARREAIYTLALARSLVATRRVEAATSLLRLAYRHGEAFRDECGRLLRELGDHAVPGLVRAPLIADPLAFRMARYAAYQLDRMNRARPELALRQAADPQLRAELLHAYGEARSVAAVRAVVSYSGAADATVRRAARWATLRYASGRRPQARKRRLKLAGGRHTQRARSLYYTYRQLVHHQLAVRFAAAMARGGKASDEQIKRLKLENDARRLAVRLFEHQDKHRLQLAQERLSKALARAKKGELALAVGTFDRVLARDPEHPQRAAIADIYLNVGKRELRGGRYQPAVLAFSKALLLLPPKESPRRAKVRAYRLLAEARRDGGSTSEWRLRRALGLYPGLEGARKELQRLEKSRGTSTAILAISAGLAGAGLLALLLFLRRRRRAAS